jgi:hypothetical protein
VAWSVQPSLRWWLFPWSTARFHVRRNRVRKRDTPPTLLTTSEGLTFEMVTQWPFKWWWLLSFQPTLLEHAQRSHTFKRRIVFLVQLLSVQGFSFQPPCRFGKPARCCWKRSTLLGSDVQAVSFSLTAKHAPPTPRLRRTEKDAKRVSS